MRQVYLIAGQAIFLWEGVSLENFDGEAQKCSWSEGGSTTK